MDPGLRRDDGFSSTDVSADLRSIDPCELCRCNAH